MNTREDLASSSSITTYSTECVVCGDKENYKQNTFTATTFKSKSDIVTSIKMTAKFKKVFTAVIDHVGMHPPNGTGFEWVHKSYNKVFMSSYRF